MGPGDLLGDRFEVDRLVATGGMGSVYRALDRETGGLVAVKTVRAGLEGDSQRRFEREAETLASLRHPGIVTYLGHGEWGGELYLVMEWLDGEDLSALLAARDLDARESLVVATGIAEALAHAHARGIVHRDIKPSNVFLVDNRPDRVKLLDFGVARRAGLATLTASGMVIGTPIYMAPEQARGRGDIDARADVWALGAVLFRCLCGRPPFLAETPEQVMARLLHESAPRVRELSPAVPREVDLLVARMLARDPERRPADAAAVAAALLGFQATSSRERAAAVAAVEPSPIPAEPIVGRAEERAIIRAALDSPTRQALLLFTAEAGMGKSRLLDDAAAEVLARDGAVFRGRAFEAEMIRPYGAWIDALRSRPLAGTEDVDLAPLLPELGDPREPGDRVRLFDAVVRHLARLAEETGPVAVLLDDLQWFDEASAALLHFVVRALDRRRVVVIAAARPDELEDNRAAARVVRDLRRDRRLVERLLAPLDAAEIAALIDAERGGVDAARVFAESEGNPLFALEMARARRGGQELGGVSLSALLDDRLARLDDAVRELLPWAAALGRTFELETLARVTGRPLASLISVAAALERRGIVRPAAAGYDFAHDLLRQAAYRQLSEPLRRSVHLEIARALATPTLSETVAGEVVHHAALGGDGELGARAAVLAGVRCLRLFANAEARDLAERGLALLPQVPRETALPLEIALYEILARSGRWLDRTQEIEVAVRRAVAEARAAGLADAVQRGLYLITINQHYRGDYDSCREVSFELAEPTTGADPATRARALGSGGRCLILLERDLDRAEGMLLEARGLAAEAHVPVLDVPLGLGFLGYLRGEDEVAGRFLAEAWARARETHDHLRACKALYGLIRIDLERGRFDRALKRCAELHPVASKMGESGEAPIAASFEALARWLAGEAGADAELERALARLAEADCKQQQAYVLVLAAARDLERGDRERARARAERALALADMMHTSEAGRARALLARLDSERERETSWQG